MNKNTVSQVEGSRKFYIKIFAIVIILFFIVYGFFMSTAGLRGSDQYWYVADTESLLNGNGVKTNNILSYNIVNDSVVVNNGFIHNVPQVYLAAIPGLLFGSFYGWLIMNAFMCIVTSMLLFAVLKKFLPYSLSVLIALLFLVMPLSFWLSYQPLAEMFHAFLITWILYIYYLNDKIRRYFLIGIISVFLLLCRSNYIIIVLVIPVLLYQEIQSRYKVLFSTLFFVSIIILFIIIKKFLPDTWNFSLYDMLITDKVGELNTSSLVGLIKIYVENTIGFFKKQFFTLGFTLIFYLPFNVFLIGTLIFWFKEKNKKFNAPVYIVAITLVFLLLTTIISQNQARYLLPFYPLVMFGFFIQIKKIYSSNFIYTMVSRFLLVAIILSVVINSFITYRTIREGVKESEIRNYYSQIYDKIIPKDESVIYYSDNYLLDSYVLRPRNVFLDLRNEEIYLKSDRYLKLIENYDIKWLITNNDYGQNIMLRYYKLELKETIFTKNYGLNGYIYKISVIFNIY